MLRWEVYVLPYNLYIPWSVTWDGRRFSLSLRDSWILVRVTRICYPERLPLPVAREEMDSLSHFKDAGCGADTRAFSRIPISSGMHIYKIVCTPRTKKLHRTEPMGIRGEREEVDVTRPLGREFAILWNWAHRGPCGPQEFGPRSKSPSEVQRASTAYQV